MDEKAYIRINGSLALLSNYFLLLLWKPFLYWQLCKVTVARLWKEHRNRLRFATVAWRNVHHCGWKTVDPQRRQHKTSKCCNKVHICAFPVPLGCLHCGRMGTGQINIYGSVTETEFNEDVTMICYKMLPIYLPRTMDETINIRNSHFSMKPTDAPVSKFILIQNSTCFG
jgi:hypothetical protein